MNTTQKGIITLLKSAITGEVLPLPEDFDIQNAEALIKSHHMAPMVYDGAVRCGIPQRHPAMGRYFQSYCKALQIGVRQQQKLRKLTAAFEENCIDYMLLKGSRIRTLYPTPELRLMGDADVLIRMEQYKNIKPIVESLGFSEQSVTDYELVWHSDALHLELHRSLLPSDNEDFYAYFGDGWRLAKYEAGTQYAMSPEDEFIYLFTHFTKHYRDGGIGCRHVVDLWVYLRSHPELDEAYVKEELNKLRLLPFYENIRSLIGVWFEDRPTDDKMDFLSEFIFASGSWGQVESKVLSRAVRDSRRALPGFSGRLVYIWKTAFPSVVKLREKYRILYKAPFLLPLVWLIRPFYKLLFERKTLKRQEQNLALLNEENLETQRGMLSYVGLDCQ